MESRKCTCESQVKSAHEPDVRPEVAHVPPFVIKGGRQEVEARSHEEAEENDLHSIKYVRQHITELHTTLNPEWQQDPNDVEKKVKNAGEASDQVDLPNLIHNH